MRITRGAIAVRARPAASATAAVPSEPVAVPAPGRWRLWELERLAAPPGDDAEARLDRVALLFELRAWAELDGAIPHQFNAVVRESFGPQLAARDAAR
jgi:hypothetical protein